MSLIVESGAGLTNAESYSSTAEVDAYNAARGNDAWAALTTAQKEIACRKATDYMVQAYRGLWIGARTSDNQGLDWPRENAKKERSLYGNGYYLNTEIPKEVKSACAELSFRAITDNLMEDLTQQVSSEAIGALSTTYDTGSPQWKRYRAVDAILRPLLCGGGHASIVRK
jgi:hypothetical protein